MRQYIALIFIVILSINASVAQKLTKEQDAWLTSIVVTTPDTPQGKREAIRIIAATLKVSNEQAEKLFYSKVVGIVDGLFELTRIHMENKQRKKEILDKEKELLDNKKKIHRYHIDFVENFRKNGDSVSSRQIGDLMTFVKQQPVSEDRFVLGLAQSRRPQNNNDINFRPGPNENMPQKIVYMGSVQGSPTYHVYMQSDQKSKGFILWEENSDRDQIIKATIDDDKFISAWTTMDTLNFNKLRLFLPEYVDRDKKSEDSLLRKFQNDYRQQLLDQVVKLREEVMLLVGNGLVDSRLPKKSKKKPLISESEYIKIGDFIFKGQSMILYSSTSILPSSQDTYNYGPFNQFRFDILTIKDPFMESITTWSEIRKNYEKRFENSNTAFNKLFTSYIVNMENIIKNKQLTPGSYLITDQNSIPLYISDVEQDNNMVIFNRSTSNVSVFDKENVKLKFFQNLDEHTVTLH